MNIFIVYLTHLAKNFTNHSILEILDEEVLKRAIILVKHIKTSNMIIILTNIYRHKKNMGTLNYLL